jgi:hypothetical protein
MEGKPARSLVASLKIENGSPRAGKVAVAKGARPQNRPAKTPEPSRLTPELKGFIDRIVVPILVKGYVENLQNEKAVAESGENATTCEPMTNAPQIEVPR